MSAPAEDNPDPRRWVSMTHRGLVTEFVNPITRTRVRLAHPMAVSVFVGSWPRIIQSLKVAWLERHEDPVVMEVTP